ncbi:MAG: hypothetical protein RR320_03230, partial [Oscillospiraceae bacterium]
MSNPRDIPFDTPKPERGDDFELLQLGEDLKDAKFEAPPIGFFMDALIRLGQNKAAVGAFVLIAFVTFMA